jgi:glycosyltransferase involved in cell wall biosynthesis
MKIGVGVPLQQPGSPPAGGPSSTCFRIAKALVKNFSDVELVFLSDHPGVKEDFTANYDIFKVHYFKTRTPQIGPKWVRNWVPIRDKILEEKFDIIWASSYSSAIAGIKSKSKTIFTVHGIYWIEDKYFPWRYYPRMRIEKMIATLYLPSIFKRCSGIVAISEYNKEECIKKGLNHRNFAVIDTPIDEIYFEPVNEKESEKPMVLCVGTVSSRKNHHNLIKAMARVCKKIPDAKLVIAGMIPNSQYFELLKKLVTENNLHKNVEFMNAPPTNEVLKLYARTWVFALPSYDESLSLATIEAMALGKPVVVANTSAFPYTTENGKCGFLCNPDKPDEIANAIIQLLEDKQLREKFGMAGKEIARRRFHPDTQAKKYMEFFRKICYSE